MPACLASPSNCSPTILHLACGACAWDSLNQLYLRSSQLLTGVQLLLLKLPPVDESWRRQAYAAYQHLYQELGFVGYYHSGAAALDAGSSGNVSGVGIGGLRVGGGERTWNLSRVGLIKKQHAK